LIWPIAEILDKNRNYNRLNRDSLRGLRLSRFPTNWRAHEKVILESQGCPKGVDMNDSNQNQSDYTCDHCSEPLTEKGHFHENLFLCDDCYIEKITSGKAHKTYYSHDPLGYFRRLKRNGPIHPQKFH